MKSCPECSGKVPETYEECPFCGYRFDVFSEPAATGEEPTHSEEEPVFSDEEPVCPSIEPVYPEGEPAFPDEIEAPPEEESNGLKKIFFEITLFILALLVAGVIVLATDFKGARTELRRMCMTDSGNGSERDSQQSRVRIKYYILVFLDLFDNGGTGASVRTNSNAFGTKPLPEDSKKKESPESQEQSNQLPSPPKVEELDFISRERPAENTDKAKTPAVKNVDSSVKEQSAENRAEVKTSEEKTQVSP